MKMNTILEDKGVDIVLNFLSKQGRGTMYMLKDFESLEGVTYTAIRTILVKLCERKILIRICRGIYYYPKDDRLSFPFIKDILRFFEIKFNVSICPKDEFAEFLIGLRKECPDVLFLHTTGKVRTINLTNGLTMKLMPTRKSFFKDFSSKKLMIVTSYLYSKENLKLSDKEENAIRNYIKDESTKLIKKDYSLIPPILRGVLSVY